MNRLKALTQRARPASRRGKGFAAGALILAGAALLSVSIFATGPTAEPEERRERAWPVSVTQITPAQLTPMFSVYGRVESSDVANLSVDVVADVRAVHVREGQWVEKGALLIELDDRELNFRVLERRAELDQAKARLRSIETEHAMVEATSKHFQAMQRIAQAKLKRHEDLFEQRMISQAVLDEAVQASSQQTISYQAHMRALADFPNRINEQRAVIDKTAAQVGQAEIDHGRSRLVAPFAGPVLAVDAAPGISTQAGRPLVTIADAGHFEIRAQVPDVYGGRFRRYLAEGADVRAITQIADQPVYLPLTRLAGNVRTGQSGLDAFFKVPDGVVPEIGRVIDMMVQLPQEPDTVALPVQSIYENDRIYRVENNRLKAVTISRVGDFETDAGEYRVLVRSPELVAGQRVITTQLPRAISGLLVETM